LKNGIIDDIISKARPIIYIIYANHDDYHKLSTCTKKILPKIRAGEKGLDNPHGPCAAERGIVAVRRGSTRAGLEITLFIWRRQMNYLKNPDFIKNSMGVL
jgi:hypothetical protein